MSRKNQNNHFGFIAKFYVLENSEKWEYKFTGYPGINYDVLKHFIILSKENLSLNFYQKTKKRNCINTLYRNR